MPQLFVKHRHQSPAKPAVVARPTAVLSGRARMQFKLVLLSIISFVSALAMSMWFFWSEPLLSPITAATRFQFLPEPNRPHSKKIVYGFLPYWNVEKVSLQPEITHLSYFALTIDGAGNLVTFQDGGTEPGYNKMRSDTFFDLSTKALANGASVELTLTQFNKDDAVSFLRSKKAQDKLFASLDAILLAYPISGINIDIELSGALPPDTRDNLTQFMRSLRTHTNTKYSNITLSIDMYAGAASSSQLWDVPAIAPEVDYIVVMAYDFHQRSSPQAGPVAPLFGGKEFWDSDINQHLQAFLQVVPPSKILLGIPFYGYEWQTTSRDAQSHTFPKTGTTAQISRVSELLAQKEELQVEEQWSEAALSPFLSYEKNGETFVIYYENSRSISYKLDYVNQLDLGGIAIWALGYEGESRELWDVIARKLEVQYTISDEASPNQ
jgi:spore germination protein YaaH